MSKNMRTVTTQTNVADMESFVKFTPAYFSEYCQFNVQELCEPTTWIVNVGDGKYNVKLYIGSETEEIIANLSINRKAFIVNERIPRMSLKEFEFNVDSFNGMIIIYSECKENCDASRTILNSIVIIPIKSLPSPIDDTKTESLGCDKRTFKGGRCSKTSDILHCFFVDKNAFNAKYCSKDLFMFKIPDSYPCKEMLDGYKCVQLEYQSELECKSFCPGSCLGRKCSK